MALDGQRFMESLHVESKEFWRQVGERGAHMAQQRLDRADIVARLKAGAWNEMRNAEVCAGWFLTTPEVDVRIGLARQIYDETRHYNLLADRLRELGEDVHDFTPLPEWCAMYDHFMRQPDTLTRLAGMQFVGENLQCDANKRWIAEAEPVDPQTAALYRDIIDPDEEYHEETWARGGVQGLPLGCVAAWRAAFVPEIDREGELQKARW